jgi:hypothetical protein
MGSNVAKSTTSNAKVDIPSTNAQVTPEMGMNLSEAPFPAQNPWEMKYRAAQKVGAESVEGSNVVELTTTSNVKTEIGSADA